MNDVKREQAQKLIDTIVGANRKLSALLKAEYPKEYTLRMNGLNKVNEGTAWYSQAVWDQDKE